MRVWVVSESLWYNDYEYTKSIHNIRTKHNMLAASAINKNYRLQGNFEEHGNWCADHQLFFGG